jgi:hypothetical protein
MFLLMTKVGQSGGLDETVGGGHGVVSIGKHVESFIWPFRTETEMCSLLLVTVKTFYTAFGWQKNAHYWQSTI